MPFHTIEGLTMSQVIRISDDLYKRLEAHATGFDTPSNVIENIINAYEGVTTNNPKMKGNSKSHESMQVRALEIIYHSGSEEDFKKQLLSTKEAYIKLHYTNGKSEVKKWNASRFTSKSRVDGNLRSGFLRGWKQNGIFKAELSVNADDFT